jgi:biopolymer transport protein ExbD
MSMNVGSEDDRDEPPMSEINTTPLVDVMLVLLIIFLITIPVVVQNVDVRLPKVRYEPTVTKPENVSLSVKAPTGVCEVYWNQSRVDSNELVQKAVNKLTMEINKQGGANAPGLELPEVHVRADVATPWRCVAGAIFQMQRAGFTKVGFISEPTAGGNARL